MELNHGQKILSLALQINEDIPEMAIAFEDAFDDNVLDTVIEMLKIRHSEGAIASAIIESVDDVETILNEVWTENVIYYVENNLKIPVGEKIEIINHTITLKFLQAHINDINVEDLTEIVVNKGRIVKQI